MALDHDFAQRLEAIRQLSPEIPAIVVTGHSDLDNSAVNALGAELLYKPYSTDDLARQVRTLLDSSSD